MFGFRSKFGTYQNSKFGGDTGCFGFPTIKDSLIYEQAEVMDNALVLDSSLSAHAKAVGEARVVKSHLCGVSLVGGKALVMKSVVEGAGRVLDKAQLHKSWLSGRAILSGNAIAEHTDIRDEVHITGDAEIYGDSRNPMILEGGLFIHSGVWTKPPRILYAEMSNYSVQECVGGNIHINCICSTPAKWMGGAGEKYSRLMGNNKGQTRELLFLTKQMRDIINGN